MNKVTLYPGDNRISLRGMIERGEKVDSVVCDPPYGLVSITKRMGSKDAAPVLHAKDGSFARLSKGFMGKTWDATGIERDPEFWRLVWEVLKPGGYIFAFSGSRTGHWQACAMEQAGFIMHPMHGWVYGSGMPKAHNPCPGIDKLMGVEGGRGAPKAGHEGHMGKDNLRSLRESGTMSQEGGFSRPWMSDPDAIEASHYQYAPGSPEAQAWDGWRHGTQSQKPALEPIYLGQKPYSEKTGALNLLKHGVGAVNIDGCRVPIDQEADASQLRTMQRGKRTDDLNGQVWGMSKGCSDVPQVVRPEGRHPANLILDGSPEVVAMFPAKAGAAAPVKGTEPSSVTNGIYGKFSDRVPDTFFGDEGSAARFFHQFPPDTDPLIYHPKAGKLDRAGGKHPTVKPIALMQYLIRHITPPGGTVLDPFAGSGTTGEAAIREGVNCILMEAEEEYVSFLEGRFGLGTQSLTDLTLLLGGEPDQLENTILDV